MHLFIYNIVLNFGTHKRMIWKDVYIFSSLKESV